MDAVLRDLHRRIDHAVLQPEATEEDVRRACHDARRYHVLSFCVRLDFPYYASGIMICTPERNPRAFIGMYFKCCHVYSRIYLNPKGTAFVGWCPKCAARAEVRVSPHGSKDRFFTADS